MREITSIEMDGGGGYLVHLGRCVRVTTRPDGPVSTLYVGGQAQERFMDPRTAERAAYRYLVSDSLLTTGQGEHAGRRFGWLPDEMQAHILRLAKQGEIAPLPKRAVDLIESTLEIVASIVAPTPAEVLAEEIAAADLDGALSDEQVSDLAYKLVKRGWVKT